MRAHSQQHYYLQQLCGKHVCSFLPAAERAARRKMGQVCSTGVSQLLMLLRVMAVAATSAVASVAALRAFRHCQPVRLMVDGNMLQ